MLSINYLFILIFTIIMLTALFSITAGLAFVFRKSALKGRESSMYYIWLVALVLAIVPIQIGEPQIILFPQLQTDNAENGQNGRANNNMIKFSDLINRAHSLADLDGAGDRTYLEQYANREVQAAENTATNVTKFKNSINISGFLKLISENIGIVMSGLLILWFIGAIFVISKTIYNYFKMKKLFYSESDICADKRISDIFSDCFKIIGLKRRVNLRIIRWDFTSPCVCGLLSPTVFIDSSCLSLSDKKLKYIFIHELYHIKRYDMMYKVLSIIVAGIHWFNPMTYKVIKTIDEDCELSVDSHVMNIFKANSKSSANEDNEASDYYMNIILDIAERKCTANTNRLFVNIPSTGLFLGEKRNIDFLKRRYANMKNSTNKTNKKRIIIALSVFMAAIIAINIITMSSCGVIGTVASASDSVSRASSIVYTYEDTNVYEAAIRLYSGLLPGEEITQEHLDQITDIKVIKGVKTNGLMTDSINQVPLVNMTPVSLIINDMKFDMIPPIVHKRVFNEYIEKKIGEKLEPRELDKINAYYMLLDSNNPDITPEDREELLATYPMTKDYVIYRFDPYTSDREYMSILGYFAAAGLIDNNFVQNDTIDAGYLTKLQNLRNAAFVGIEAKNLDLLPDTISTAIISQEENPDLFIDNDGYVSVNDNRFSADSADMVQNSSDQPISGVFDPPNYGINPIEFDASYGTEYLEFKNISLQAAIAEYFAGTPEYFGFIPWLPITTDMLSQITSINVRRIPEYDYLYDYPEAQMPSKGMYLEYTINGKTLDILPEFFMPDIEMSFVQDSFDINQYFDKIDTGTIFEAGGLKDFPGYYHYTVKSDLSDKDGKLYLSSIFAKTALIRLAIYQDENGGYFTVGRPDIWGFTPRYYDQPEYDTTDIAYMPNLKDFTLDGISEKKIK